MSRNGFLHLSKWVRASLNRGQLILFPGLLCMAIPFAWNSASAASTQAPDTHIRLFANGAEGYACYRIPAIVRTPDGTLLAFAEARKNNCADFGDVRVVLLRSHNGGKTWGPMQVVAENGTLQADNATPVVDTMDSRYPHGRVFLLYSTGDAPSSAVLAGKGTRRVWVRTSVDDGATWSKPVEITASVKLPSWRDYATGPVHALQLTIGPHRGRLVIPAYHSAGPEQSKNRQYEANSFFSDDHGRTWHLGGTIAWPGSNESTVAQTVTGEVVMNSRDESASHARILSFSKDGGDHWEGPFAAFDLPDPVCQGSMLRYSLSGGKSVLLFSNAGSPSKRVNLTISVSRDGGHTWPKHTVIFPGPAGYSDIVVMPKGRLGVLWEKGGGGKGIAFSVVPIQPLL